MRLLRRLNWIFFITLVLCAFIHATSAPTLPFSIDTQDKIALQRGARFYMNYCSGCHSLKYMRYNRMAQDLGLTTFTGQPDEPLLKNNLIFTQAAISDPIEVSMSAEDARQWFGITPPDLSLTARSRGAAWIYTYLLSFYEDEKRPFHSNNLLFPDVGMPDVLAPLRGRIKLTGGDHSHLIQVEAGTMNNAAFHQELRDLVTFLVYVGEPIRDERKKMGYGVMIFLSILFVVMFLLNRLYWIRLKSHDKARSK